MYKLVDGISVKADKDNYKIYNKSNEYLGEVDKTTYDLLNLCDGNHEKSNIVEYFTLENDYSEQYVEEQVAKAINYLCAFDVIKEI